MVGEGLMCVGGVEYLRGAERAWLVLFNNPPETLSKVRLGCLRRSVGLGTRSELDLPGRGRYITSSLVYRQGQ